MNLPVAKKAEAWDRHQKHLANLGYYWEACPLCAHRALVRLRAERYSEAETLLDKALHLHIHLLPPLKDPDWDGDELDWGEQGQANLTQVLWVIILILFIAVLLRYLGLLPA